MQKRHHFLVDFDDDDDARGGGHRGTGGDRRSLVESKLYYSGTAGGGRGDEVNFADRDRNRGSYYLNVVQHDAPARRSGSTGDFGGGDRKFSSKAGPPPMTERGRCYHSHEDDYIGRREDDDEDEDGDEDEVIANTDTTVHVALALFSVLGMGTLFPYNALVACSDYFEALYPDVAEGGGGSVAGRLATTSIVSLFITTVLMLPLTTVTADDGCDEWGEGGGVSSSSHHSSERSIHGIAMTESSPDNDIKRDTVGDDSEHEIREEEDHSWRQLGRSRISWWAMIGKPSSLLRALRTDPTRRIALGYATVSFVLLTLPIFSYRLPLNAALALAFLIGAGDAVSQSQLYVHAAGVDGRCTASVAFGSAAAGLIVSLLRLTTKAIFDGEVEAGDDDENDGGMSIGVGMRRDGAAFFGTSSLVLVGCMLALRVVVATDGRIRLAFARAAGKGGSVVGAALPTSEWNKGHGVAGGGGGGLGGGISDEGTAFSPSSSSATSPSNSPPRVVSSPSSRFADEAFHLASSFSNDRDDSGDAKGASSAPFHDNPRESRRTTDGEVELLSTNWNVAFRAPNEDRTGTGGGRKFSGDHYLVSENEGKTAPAANASFPGDDTPPHTAAIATTGYYSALPPPLGVNSSGIIWRWARALPLHPVYQETLAVSWKPTVATFFNSFVTLSLFPGTVTSMRSVDEDGDEMGSSSWSSWLPVLLVFVYNLFDCVGRGSLACRAVADLVRHPLGRAICDPAQCVVASATHGGGEGGGADRGTAAAPVVVGYELPRFTAVVGLPCAVRVIFIPVVAMCVVPRPTPWITSNWARFAIVSSFALTNGYVNAACFVAGPTMTSHNRAHRDSSSLVLLLAGFTGLVAGGFFGMFLDGLLTTAAIS